jgi:hypothetical protein
MPCPTGHRCSAWLRDCGRLHRLGGFGLLTRAAVFPHFDARGPEAAIKESAAHPDQLAIGIDNQTALIIKDNQIEAVGLGTVSLYNASGRGSSTSVILRSGERYDLAVRPQAAVSRGRLASRGRATSSSTSPGTKASASRRPRQRVGCRRNHDRPRRSRHDGTHPCRVDDRSDQISENAAGRR